MKDLTRISRMPVIYRVNKKLFTFNNRDTIGYPLVQTNKNRKKIDKSISIDRWYIEENYRQREQELQRKIELLPKIRKWLNNILTYLFPEKEV